MVEMTDNDLLDQLSGALGVSSVKPDEATMSRLYATLAELDANEAEATVTPVHGAPRTLRRKYRTRGSLLAAVASTLFLTAGVAVAAVATNTLPGFTRNAAYDLGLPVTSPALVHTQQAVAQLRLAITAHDSRSEKVWGDQVRQDLTTLTSSDLRQISGAADTLLIDVGLIPPVVPGNSSTTTTPGSTPTVTVPSVSVPSVTTPSVTVPGSSVSLPPVTVPKVTTPSVRIPSVTTPRATVPGVTLPTVTVPSLKKLF